MGSWSYYNHAIIPESAPHEKIDATNVKQEMKRKNALFARYVTDFDCGYETPFWCCIKDDAFDITALKAKRRYEINKGVKNYYIKTLSKQDLEDMYGVYLDSMRGYLNPTIQGKEEFVNYWKTALNLQETLMLGAVSIKTNKLCGYAHIPQHGRYIAISSFKTRVDEEKNGVNFALTYGICDYFKEKLDNKEIYLCDGYRNILHETNFQDWLIKYFGFRRAYCNLHMVYRPLVCFLIKLVYPFRKVLLGIIPSAYNKQVKAIFNMEEWSRKCRKLKERNL